MPSHQHPADPHRRGFFLVDRSRIGPGFVLWRWIFEPARHPAYAANLRVAETSSSTIPGSVMAWPASPTMRSSASGQARVQLPGALHRVHHIVAALHDHAGMWRILCTLVEQLVVALEEAAVDEVVALDAREGDGVVVGAEQSRRARGPAAVTACRPPTRSRRARPRAARRVGTR